MPMMCFIFFGINTSDDLSLSSPYWLIGIVDSFLSWTNRAASTKKVFNVQGV
jgi:hypothetical protein